MAAPGGLAIDRKDRPVHAGRFGRVGTQRLQPIHKAPLKRIWFQERQHTPKNVFARNAVRQIQHLQEKFCFELGPFSNRRWTTGTRQHRHHRDDDDADKRVFLIDVRTWILKFVKESDNLIQTNVSNIPHRSVLRESQQKATPQRTIYGMLPQCASLTQIAQSAR